MIARLWTERSLAERTALIFLGIAAIFRTWLAFYGSDPVDTAGEWIAVAGGVAFLVIFAVLAIPVAVAVALFGGREFAAPWRRTFDRLLPAATLGLLWLAFTAGQAPI